MQIEVGPRFTRTYLNRNWPLLQVFWKPHLSRTNEAKIQNQFLSPKCILGPVSWDIGKCLQIYEGSKRHKNGHKFESIQVQGDQWVIRNPPNLKKMQTTPEDLGFTAGEWHHKVEGKPKGRENAHFCLAIPAHRFRVPPFPTRCLVFGQTWPRLTGFFFQMDIEFFFSKI